MADVCNKTIIQMRKLVTKLLKTISLFLLILGSLQVDAQDSNFNYTIANDIQVSDRILEFDLFLLDTDINSPFELAATQAGIIVNSGIYNGGTISVSIVSGFSQLNPSQQPASIIWVQATNAIKLTPKSPPGAGSGTIISQTAPGTRVCRIRITNSVAFTINSTANLTFNFTTAPYPTKVSQYILGINTPLTCDASNCFSNAANIVLNPPVLPPTAFNVTGSGSYCEGSSGLPVGLDDSETGVTYTLYKNLTETITTASGTGAAISFGNQTAGNYTVSGTNAGGTTPMSGSATIAVNPLPTVTFTGTLTAQCVSSTAYALSGATPVGGTYSGPGVTGTNFNASSAGTGTHTITYTFTNGSGCTNTATNTITVNALPAVTFTGTLTAQCVSSTTYALSGGSPTGGTYSGPGVTGTNFNASSAGTGTHTITYTFTNGSSCTNTATNTITVNALPTVTFTGTLTAQCVSSTTYALIGGSPAGGIYSGPGVTGTNFNASSAGTGTHTITYIFTNGSGCTNTATNTITVNATPLAPTGTSPQTFCSGTTPTVANLTATGSTIKWYDAANGGNLLGSSTALVNGTHYYASQTSASGCESTTRLNVAAIINTTPTAPSGSGSQSFCSGTSPVVSNLVATGTTIKWYNSLTGGTQYQGDDILVNGTHYYASQTSISGCESTLRLDVTVTVNTTPFTPAGAASQTFCSGTTPTVANLTVTGTTIKWYDAAIGGNLLASSTALNNGIHYYASQTSAAGCESTSRLDVTVTVNTTPVAPSGAASQIFCSSTTPTVANLTATGSTIKWYDAANGGNLLGSSTALVNGTHYYASQTSALGCESISRLDVNVTVTTTPAIINQLTSILTGDIFIVTPSGAPAGTTYTWTAPSYVGGVTGGSAQTTSQLNISGTLTIPTGAGTATYTVTPANGSCIGAPFTVLVNVSSSCVPVIMGTQPADKNMCVISGNASFTAGATGTSPTYQWQYNNGGTWGNITNGIPAGSVYTGGNTSTLGVSGVTTAGSFQYHCYITNCSGSSNVTSNTATLTVNALPAVSFTGTLTAQCVSSTTYALSGGTPAGGTYSGPGVTGTNFNASSAGTGTHTITYTFTNGSGCTNTATNTITVNALPAVTFTGTLTAQCASSTTYALSGGLPAGGTYSGTGVTGTNFNASSAGTGTHTITYTYTNGSGCTNTATNTITVNATPLSPTGASPQTFCSGTTPTVANLTASGTTIKWYDAASGGNLIATSTTLVNGAHYFAGQTAASGCESILRYVVNAVVTQTPIVTNQTTSIQTGTTFTVSPGGAGVPAGTTYTWTSPTYTGGVTGGSTQSTPQQNISGNLTIPSGAGTANYTVIPSYGGCTGTPFTVTVFVTSTCIPVTIDSQPADKNMCVSSGNASFTIGITGTSPFTYQWQYNNGGTWSNVTTGTPAGASYTGAAASTLNVTGITQAGSFQYRCNISNCGGGISLTSNSVTLTVNALPVTPTIGPVTQPTCSNATGTITVSAPAGAGITYSIDGSTYTNSTGVFNNVPTGIYTVTVRNSNGCISPGTGVTINGQPATPTAPTVTLTQPTCNVATGTITITAPVGVGMTYSIDGSNYTNTNGIFSPVASGSYTVTSRSAAGCVSAGTAAVINIQPSTPTLVITNPNPVCSPSTVNITAAAISSGSTSGLTFTYWTNAGATITYSTPSTAGAGTYYIKGTTLAGCFDIKPVIVTVTQVPAATAGNGGNECDLTFRFNATPSVGTGIWSKTTGTGTATFSPGSSSPDATVTVSAFGTYTFTWTEINGTCSASNTVTVNFYQQPVANAGPGGNNCGLGFNLIGSLNVGSGTWTKLSGPGNVTFVPVNSPNSIATVTVYGTYTFKWTVTNGTCSGNSTTDVTFIELPAANAGVGGVECDLDFVFHAIDGFTQGTWSKVSGPGNATFDNSSLPDANVTVDQIGTYEFAWTTIVNGLCTSTDLITVSFHDLPEVSAGRDTIICEDGSAQLQATGAGTFAWQPAVLIINPNIADPVAIPFETTIFTATLTDQFGCKNTDEVEVEVRNKPVADAGPDRELEYLFSADMEAAQLNIHETGVWSVIMGSGQFSSPAAAETKVSGLALGENIVLWRVSNGVCQHSDDYVTILVNDLLIPSLITPNGDDYNQYFKLQGMETLGTTDLTIFDRRGAQVYKNTNYDNSWYGQDFKGNELPDDTYFYVIKSQNGKSLSGFIVIRR